jgi:hypothetical protein
MLLGLEGLESRVMPDLVHRLIRFKAEVLSRLQIASRGRFGFHFGTIVVANSLAESELMRRDTATPISRPVYMLLRSFNLNPVIDARPR